MALDSKQKRGSAIGILSPSRQWLTEPTGTIDTTPRQSLLKLCSAIAAEEAGGEGSTVIPVLMNSYRQRVA